jgi:hypothetical protein
VDTVIGKFDYAVNPKHSAFVRYSTSIRNDLINDIINTNPRPLSWPARVRLSDQQASAFGVKSTLTPHLLNEVTGGFTRNVLEFADPQHPRTYEIRVHSTMTLNMQIPAVPAVWGRATVAVNGSDVTGVVIPLERAPTISGRLFFRDDGSSPEQRPTVKVTLGASEALLISARGGGRPVVIGPDGRFTFDEVSGGRYTIATELSGPSAEEWDVESAMVNGRDILDFGLDVNQGGPPASELTLTLTRERPFFGWRSSRRLQSRCPFKLEGARSGMFSFP